MHDLRFTGNSASFTRGFTLVELSVVLIIMSVVAGSGLAVLNRLSIRGKLDATQTHMDAIEEALLQFRTVNNRLPCPANAALNPNANNYGVEAENPGACIGGTNIAANFSGAVNSVKTGTPPSDAVGGMVPVITLGLPVNYAYDGYGNKISYHVDAKATAYAAFSTYSISNSRCFDLVVDDERPWTGGDRNYHTLHAAYVLVSHGPDGHGAFSKGGPRLNKSSTNALQNENANYTAAGAVIAYNNLFYSVKEFHDPNDEKNQFDDVLRYKTREGLYTYQDSPGHYFPDLILATYNANLNFYYKCGDKFIREQAGATSATTANINTVAIAPDNASILLGVNGNHFRIWEYDGLVSAALPDSSFTPYPLGVAYNADAIAWDKTGGFLVGSMDNAAATPETRIAHYEKAGTNVYKRTAENAFVNVNAMLNTYGAFQISPDGTEVMIVDSATAAKTPQLHVAKPDGTYEYKSDAFDPAPVNNGGNDRPAWSADGNYLIIPSRLLARIEIYRNDGNHHYTLVQTLTTGNRVHRAAISPDGRFIAALQISSNSWQIFERKANDLFQLVSNPPSALPANGASLAFSPDGNYLAVGLAANNPNLIIYKRNNADFVRLTAPNGPDSTPNVNADDLAWKNLMEWERAE